MKRLMLLLGGAAALMLASCGSPSDSGKPGELGPDTAAVEKSVDVTRA